MTRSQLVQRLATKKTSLGADELERGVKYMLKNLAARIARGERVEIRGFGSFELRHRHAREARNPRSGHLVHLENRFVILFKPSRELCHEQMITPKRTTAACEQTT